jgi:hypothetical protein
MRWLLQILIKYYVNRYSNLEIVKLTPEEELEFYQLSGPQSALRVLKSNITVQTLRHFEAKTEQERWMVKGAALALQLIKDRHLLAVKLDGVKDPKRKMKMWQEFKILK